MVRKNSQREWTAIREGRYWAAHLVARGRNLRSGRGSSGLRTKTKVNYYETKTRKYIAKRRNMTTGRAPRTHPTRASLVPTMTIKSAPVVPSAPVPAAASRTRVPEVSGTPSNPRTSKKQRNENPLQIPSFGFIDVCFCVDATGSMVSELAQVQEVIKTIIANIQAKVQTEGLQMRFAIVTYRDHPPQESSYVTNHLDFTNQYEAIEYLKTLTAMGGGDEPEAAHDGLMKAAKQLNWAQVDGTPVLRYIFHVADAPPHGKEFTNPEPQNGCLCGLQTDDVIRQINRKSIHYRLVKVRTSPKLDEMEKVFRGKVGDFACTDIGHARELNVKVSDMIICEVLPDWA